MATNARLFTGRRTIGECSLDTRAIYDVLTSTEPRALLTYEELTQVVGRDVRLIWGSVHTAERMAMREHGYVFGVVRGVGLKRLTPSEIAALPESTITRIRRAVAREMRRQAVVVDSELTNNEKLARNTRLSILGALAEFTKPSSCKLLDRKELSTPLPTAKVLELFR